MAVLEVEDLTGSIEVVAFPDTYEQYSEVISEDAILDIQAKVDERGEKKQLILEQATAELPRPKMLERARPLVIIVLPSSAELWQDINAMQKVDDLLRRHEGPNPVEFHISAGTDVLRLRSRTRCVEWTTELERDLSDVLGANGVFLTEPAPVTVNQEEGIDPSEPPIDEDFGMRDVA